MIEEMTYIMCKEDCIWIWFIFQSGVVTALMKQFQIHKFSVVLSLDSGALFMV